ncbi:MAG: TIR domain-containing protein [Anaerolineae bacterium]|nr:TIR domain-containing protein [Anaerolineae bacterium]
MTLQVFISYKSQERSFAEQLRDQLRAWGFSTWLDKDNIPEGAYFRHEIQKGLETSQVVIGLLTEEALQSREVMWEWDYALYNSRLIPVMLRPCKLPYHLQGTQYLDFTQPNTTAFDRLRQAITSPLGAQYIAPNPASITKLQITTSTSATNRARMLDKVHEFWVVGVLENALKESGTFELGLSAVPGAVLKHIDYGDYQLPSTAGIGEVFNDLNRELLILGAPGAGKTILLLQLARHLIERARADETQPIPVIFNLSSWAAERKSLEDWLVSELRLKYQVPQKVAQEWIEHEKLLLLLDGLDEVAEEFRNQCVDAINIFRRTFKAIDLAVCSRIADYEPLTSKLDLRGAIVLQSLNADQINTYLNRPELEGLRTVLKTDTVLQEMVETPFLLNTMAYCYQNISPRSLQIPPTENSIKQRRNYLFDTYIEKLLNQSNQLEHHSPHQIRLYLKWLASKMVKFQQTVFYIEGLQPAWLEINAQKREYRVNSALLTGMIAGSLTFISVNFLGIFSIEVCVVLSLFTAFIGLIVAVRPVGSGRAEISYQSPFVWYLIFPVYMFSRFLSHKLGIGTLTQRIIFTVGFISSIFFIIRIDKLDRIALTAMCSTVIFMVLMQILAFSMRAAARSVSPQTKTTLIPNEGTVSNIINAVFTTMIIMSGSLVLGFSYRALQPYILIDHYNEFVFQILKGSELGIIFDNIAMNTHQLAILGELLKTIGVITGIMSSIGLVGILLSLIGAVYVARHLALRHILYRAGHIPWNYARFLDYCTSIGLLRKVGGGYIFAHRYLLEYFAEVDA